MQYRYPDYENGLVNLMSSIMSDFHIRTTHTSLKSVDKELKKNYKNIVLVLFDGLGYNILKRNQDVCSFLNKHLKTHISSVFPSTTMAARTTVESGLNPVEHGWLGWDMYFKEFNAVITLTRNYIKGTKRKPAPYHVAKTLLKYESIVDHINKQPGCHSEKITVYSDRKNESFRKARKKIKKITKNPFKNYIYFYSNEPDHIEHKYGTDSKEERHVLKKLDKEFQKMCTSLKDTLVLGISDHGHLNCDYITLSDYPEIVKMLDENISIDNRACSFRVKKEYLAVFPKKIKEVLKEDFILMSKDEIIEKKLYGYGKENKYYRDGLGDYFAIGIGNKAIRYDENTKKHKSSHSGLTDEEMLVPLILYRSK